MKTRCKSISIIGSVVVVATGACWGCADKQPSPAEQKKELAGEPGKKFDPSSVPAQYREGFEKWQKSDHAKVSGPANVTGP